MNGDDLVLKTAKVCLIIGMAMACYLYMMNPWPWTFIFVLCLMIGTATWVWVYNTHLIWPGKRYRVGWMNLDTCEEGHGRSMPKKLAEAWVIYGKRNYPKLAHWVEEVNNG